MYDHSEGASTSIVNFMIEFFINLFVQPWKIFEAIVLYSIEELHYYAVAAVYLFLNGYYYGVYAFVGLPFLIFAWPWFTVQDLPIWAWIFEYSVNFVFGAVSYLWDIISFVYNLVSFFVSMVYLWITSNMWALTMEYYDLQYAYISNEEAWLNDEAPFDGTIFNAENPDYKFGFLWAYFDGLTKFKFFILSVIYLWPMATVVWIWTTYYTIITYPFVLTLLAYNWTVESTISVFTNFLLPFYQNYLVTGF